MDMWNTPNGFSDKMYLLCQVNWMWLQIQKRLAGGDNSSFWTSGILIRQPAADSINRRDNSWIWFWGKHLRGNGIGSNSKKKKMKKKKLRQRQEPDYIKYLRRKCTLVSDQILSAVWATVDMLEFAGSSFKGTSIGFREHSAYFVCSTLSVPHFPPRTRLHFWGDWVFGAPAPEYRLRVFGLFALWPAIVLKAPILPA